MAAESTIDLPVGHKTVRVTVTADGGLELWLNGCLRKRREPSDRDPLYVWTNVELYWRNTGMSKRATTAAPGTGLKSR